MEGKKTRWQRIVAGGYYFLYALGCLAYLSSIFWILMDMMFNMPDKIWAVFLGIICGALFLKVAKKLRK